MKADCVWVCVLEGQRGLRRDNELSVFLPPACKEQKKNSSTTEKDLGNIWGTSVLCQSSWQQVSELATTCTRPTLAVCCSSVVCVMAPICQKLTATSLLFFFLFSPLVVALVVVSILPSSGEERNHRGYICKKAAGEPERHAVCCASVLVWPFTHPRSLDQVSDQSCGRVREKWIEREREWGGQRCSGAFSVVFCYISLSFFLHLLPSSPFPRLKQGRESKFFPGASTSLKHPGVHRSAGLQDAAMLPGNVSIQSKTRQIQRKVLKVITVPITNSLTCISVMETNEALFKKLIVPFANGRASRWWLNTIMPLTAVNSTTSSNRSSLNM